VKEKPTAMIVLENRWKLTFDFERIYTAPLQPLYTGKKAASSSEAPPPYISGPAVTGSIGNMCAFECFTAEQNVTHAMRYMCMRGMQAHVNSTFGATTTRS